MSDPHSRFFARWSRFYERTPFFTRYLNAQQDEALKRLDALPHERVLDLGCGPGRALDRLPHRAVGADASLAMLAEGPARAACSLAAALPFRSASFDALLCTNSFHHYPEPLATLREMRRVLKPGGRLVLVDPNQGNPLARAAVYGGEALVFGMTVHLHSQHEWLRFCTEAGFARAEVSTLNFGLALLVHARA